MNKKQWTGKEKFKILMLGVSGNAEICNEHGITQGLYYKWHDKIFSDGEKLFERGGVDTNRKSGINGS